MAGIGFELKKLFEKKGFFRTVRAYSYSSVICAGPMLLGVLLLLGIMYLCTISGTPEHTRELLICMITYTLLASLLVSSFFSMVVTRFLADMLYENQLHHILPSYWGSSVIMQLIGTLLYGSFLLFSGASPLQQLLMIILFNELILSWNAMSYLTAIKDYRGIFLAFMVSVLLVFVFGFLLLHMQIPVIEALLTAVTIGYGFLAVYYILLLCTYFPESDLSPFLFLRWIDSFLPLAFTGFLSTVGMFAHLLIMWFSEVGVHVHGLFYGAPYHDVPALLAFLSTLITTVNFVVSVEVHFYPKYKNHYALYNDKGTIKDIQQSEREMVTTLKLELLYTSLKQLLFTAICIGFGGLLLDVLPLGFNELMRGYFRTLCVAYGLYAIGNIVMLISLYFTDYQGTLISTAVFATGSIIFSLISLLTPSVYYGFGFLLASFLYVLIGILRLNTYLKRLPYYILAIQPLVPEDKSGFFTRTGTFLETIFLGGTKP